MNLITDIKITSLNKITNKYNSSNEQYEFQTNTRGIKLRGVFPTQEEAELRCKLLRESAPNHDVYVGPVGVWMPWDPDAYKTGKVDYLEEELNELMNEKTKNEEYAKVEFEKPTNNLLPRRCCFKSSIEPLNTKLPLSII